MVACKLDRQRLAKSGVLEIKECRAVGILENIGVHELPYQIGLVSP
jgi:hypothetical protein